MARAKKKLILISGLFVVAALAGWMGFASLQRNIETRLKAGRVLTPIEFYAHRKRLQFGRRLPEALAQEFVRQGWTENRDYRYLDNETCAQENGALWQRSAEKEIFGCLFIRQIDGQSAWVGWDAEHIVRVVQLGDEFPKVLHLFPEQVAQFLDGQPLQQEEHRLSDYPLYCLQAVTAIEDRDFLQHSGVSPSGTLRALIRNLRAGRFAEGGSTITQQLVKNFFLNSKKTIKRKLQEQALALMLEGQLSKDQILEMYLNVIYMGQNGPYQVRGFGSAARHYFDKNLSDLNLSECALLAAVINNPGRYSPLAQKESAQGRMQLVLQKMVDNQMLNPVQKDTALWPQVRSNTAQDQTQTPYFFMATLRELVGLGLGSQEETLKVYTTLDWTLQKSASQAVSIELPRIEAGTKQKGLPLQVALIAVDIATGEVLATIGGRDYRSSPFNRSTDSRRQIGSIVKPVVYLAALEQLSPLSTLPDKPLVWKTKGPAWQPKNYDGKTLGEVPLFYALAQSLNLPTAAVGQQIGLPRILKMFRELNVSQEIPELPSMTLGAVELSPMEVARMYLSLASFGRSQSTALISQITTTSGEVLFQRDETPPSVDQQLQIHSAQVASMMQNAFLFGTAQAAKSLTQDWQLAGKTGTTSDSVDNWFVGFSPEVLTVVWVGFDENQPTGLTGASGALPLWQTFMARIRSEFSHDGFQWPDGLKKVELDREQVLQRFPNLKNLPEQIELQLQPGQGLSN